MQYINASNIHRGGGAKLLKSILELNFKDKALVYVDARFSFKSLKIGTNIKIKLIEPTLLSRFFVEWNIAKLTKKNDYLLCFGNLPPLFKNKAYTSLFLQNRFLVEDIKLYGFSFSQKIRIFIERIWIRFFINRAQKILVQSSSMKFLVQRQFKKLNVEITPFYQASGFKFSKTKKRTNNKNYFLYVATGEPHKNHVTLIEAWIILSKEKIFPELLLTLDHRKDSKLISKIEFLKFKYKLKIKNLGFVENMDVIYKNARALIYPSTLESFGLPLIEASFYKLPIIASELDFVRDITDPIESFNPYSAISIARALKRFLHVQKNSIELVDAYLFIEAQKN